jgi:hypothetical protein
MPAFPGEVNWKDPSKPPHEGLIPIHRAGGVRPPLWWGYTTVEGVDTRPMVERILIWHWCDHSVWIANGADPEKAKPKWQAAGVGAHDLKSLSPLELEPSLLLDTCCGLHGFVRKGRWVDA